MKLTGNTFLHFFSQLSAFICPGLDTRDKRPELDLHEAEAAVLIEIVMSCVVIVCPRALSREALILLVGVEAGSPSHRMRLRSRVRARRVAKAGDQGRCLLAELLPPLLTGPLQLWSAGTCLPGHG